MEKYKFSVDGIYVNLYPLSKLQEGREQMLSELSDGEIAVLLLPDTRYDFRIECFDKSNTEPREPHVPLAALFCFFTRVRSYPDMTLSIGYHDREYEFDLIRHKEYAFSVNLSKCKVISTNTLIFNDGAEISVDVVECHGVYAFHFVSDAEMVGEDRLRLLFERVRDKGIKAVIVFSTSDRLCIRTVGDISFIETITALPGYMATLGHSIPTDKYEAVINGAPHEISIHGSAITFYPEIKNI